MRIFFFKDNKTSGRNREKSSFLSMTTIFFDDDEEEDCFVLIVCLTSANIWQRSLTVVLKEKLTQSSVMMTIIIIYRIFSNCALRYMRKLSETSVLRWKNIWQYFLKMRTQEIDNHSCRDLRHWLPVELDLFAMRKSEDNWNEHLVLKVNADECWRNLNQSLAWW